MVKRVSSRSLKSGTVFEISLSEVLACYGQILESGIDFYMCVYEGTVPPGQAEASSIIGRRIVLIGRTTDALFQSGDWKILGESQLPENYPRPCHVVFTPNGLELHDFDGNFLRPANAKDQEKFDFKLSVSPIRFVIAMRGLCGITDFPIDYSNLLVTDALQRVIN